MRILVTGGSGYIGKNLVSLLRTTNHQLYCPQGRHELDVCDFPDLMEKMDWFKPEAVVHLAAYSKVSGNPDEMVLTNVLGTHNLLQAAPKGCKFVYASSCSVYGTSQDDKWHNAFNEHSKTRPESVYAATKLAAESLVFAYSNLGLVQGVSARLVAQVGPHSTHGLFHDIVRKLCSDSEYLELLGDSPGSIKPLMHVSDTCHYLLDMVEQTDLYDNSTGVVNIAPGDSISVERAAEVCMQELGIRKPIKWLGWQANFAGDSPNLFVSARMANSAHLPRYGSSECAVRQAAREVLEKWV